MPDVIFNGPEGRLEGRYLAAKQPNAPIALMLHPHPQHGGTMHNKVVYRAAKALEACGVETLRFNFRGVGASSGAYDEGRGEVDDAGTAFAWLLAQQPAAREALVAGFSFGASIGLRFGCAEPRATRLLAIGTPGRWLSAAGLVACEKAIDFIHGARDDVAPLADLEAVLAAASRPAPTRLHVVPDAGHFFEGHLDELGRIVAESVG